MISDICKGLEPIGDNDATCTNNKWAEVKFANNTYAKINP